MYRLIRSLLFRLQPERAHELTFSSLQLLGTTPLRRVLPWQVTPSPRTVMGLEFPNPVGLAAGMDKNGDYLDVLGLLGFGFVELGTVTPRPQSGNPAPRVFRLPAAEALINRMGFNNQGIDHLVANLRGKAFDGVVGINIGKNRDTPNENAVDDYLTCLRKAYPHAGYVAINLSSPNTPGLRDLQHGDALSRLLDAIKREQKALHDQYGRYVPLALKIAPDLSDDQIAEIARAVEAEGIDAVIATNTTMSRDGVEGQPHADEAGGLSGRPLADTALAVQRRLRSELDPQIPIIAVGGILSGRDAEQRSEAGASLVQIYTGLIYRGPGLVKEIARALAPPRQSAVAHGRETSGARR